MDPPPLPHRPGRGYTTPAGPDEHRYHTRSSTRRAPGGSDAGSLSSGSSSGPSTRSTPITPTSAASLSQQQGLLSGPPVSHSGTPLSRGLLSPSTRPITTPLGSDASSTRAPGAPINTYGSLSAILDITLTRDERLEDEQWKAYFASLAFVVQCCDQLRGSTLRETYLQDRVRRILDSIVRSRNDPTPHDPAFMFVPEHSLKHIHGVEGGAAFDDIAIVRALRVLYGYQVGADEEDSHAGMMNVKKQGKSLLCTFGRMLTIRSKTFHHYTRLLAHGAQQQR